MTLGIIDSPKKAEKSKDFAKSLDYVIKTIKQSKHINYSYRLSHTNIEKYSDGTFLDTYYSVVNNFFNHEYTTQDLECLFLDRSLMKILDTFMNDKPEMCADLALYNKWIEYRIYELLVKYKTQIMHLVGENLIMFERVYEVLSEVRDIRELLLYFCTYPMENIIDKMQKVKASNKVLYAPSYSIYLYDLEYLQNNGVSLYNHSLAFLIKNGYVDIDDSSIQKILASILDDKRYDILNEFVVSLRDNKGFKYNIIFDVIFSEKYDIKEILLKSDFDPDILAFISKVYKKNKRWKDILHSVFIQLLNDNNMSATFIYFHFTRYYKIKYKPIINNYIKRNIKSALHNMGLFANAYRYIDVDLRLKFFYNIVNCEYKMPYNKYIDKIKESGLYQKICKNNWVRGYYKLSSLNYHMFFNNKDYKCILENHHYESILAYDNTYLYFDQRDWQTRYISTNIAYTKTNVNTVINRLHKMTEPHHIYSLLQSIRFYSSDLSKNILLTDDQLQTITQNTTTILYFMSLSFDSIQNQIKDYIKNNKIMTNPTINMIMRMQYNTGGYGYALK
jgi:hypothetical protein